MAFYLVFRDKLFNEITQAELLESDLAVLVIDNNESTLYFHESINLIDKLTAQRQVNSIVKTGFLLSSNQRVGSNTNLKVVVGSIPANKTEETIKENHDIKTIIEKEPNVTKEPETINEKVAEIYEQPIRFDVSKDTSHNGDNADVSGFTSLDNLGANDNKNDISIGDIFREEQKKVMEGQKQPEQKKEPRNFEDVVDYFWKELFGQVYSSWDSLPAKAKEDFFSSLNITQLSDNELHELFAIRHENNINAFKQKLAEFQEKNKTLNL